MSGHILLIIKSKTFSDVKIAARKRSIAIYNLAVNDSNLNEFRALTSKTNLLRVQRWFREEDPCLPGSGYPIGTLLFFRLVEEDSHDDY